MKYLTDKDLSLNAKGFLSMILFNDEINALELSKYCSDDIETIKDTMLELRIMKYVKYDPETNMLLAGPKPYDEWEWDFAPLDAGDAKSSLSAILFEKDFYGFILDNKVDSNGISTMRLEGLIPLKCLAYLELSKESNPSPKVLANIEKHRQDIFRLAEVLPGGSFQLPTNVAEITKEALQLIASKTQNDEAFEILEMLRQFYLL